MEKEPRFQEGLLLDIMYEILLRLPVKTLSRFQCVSQTWRSIIKNLSFREDHYRRSHKNPLLLTTSHEFKPGNDADRNPVTKSKSNTNSLHLSSYNKEGTLMSKFSKTELQQCPYVPIQSCLGLVCIGPMSYWYDNPILICNPSTEELMALPPTQCYHLGIGFGYVASTKEFKVVRFSTRPDEFYRYIGVCEVFVLGASEWRKARNPPPPLQYQFEWGAPFLQGGLHLLPSVKSFDPDDCMYVFDIDKEEYTTIPFPDYYHSEELLAHSEEPHLYLKEFEGSLYIIFDFTRSLELWCLKDYDNREWVKEYTIDLNPLGFYVFAEPIAIIGDGCVLLSIESEEGDASLHCYRSYDKRFMPKMEAKGSVILYTESFLTLGSRL